MRINLSRFKGIMIIIVCIALYFTFYPLYIKWIAGNYAEKFADVLNSHDMERYDSFFSEDTIFELDGRQIKYIDAKENMEKVQAFTSKGSYGHLEEGDDFKELIRITCFRKEYTVNFFLPVSDYQDGENIVNAFIEGEMILKRKGMFFLDIEKVTFYDDCTGFLEDFLGVCDRDNSVAVIKETDMIEICVEGFTMTYTPQSRKLAIDDFQDIELGDSIQDIEEQLGEADGWIGSGILRPVYVLEDGRTVVCCFTYPQVCQDLRELTVYNGHDIDYV